MPCMKRVYKEKLASVHWSAARNKERFLSRGCTGYQPLVNRSLCSPINLHRISLVRASGATFRRRVFDALEKSRKDCPLGAQFYWKKVPLDPAPPPRRAPRRDPPVVCPGFGFDKFVLIPGHALHEKGLQRQKGIVPLVVGQEQRALFVPLVNRRSTGDFVPPSVYIGFRLFVLLERR